MPKHIEDDKEFVENVYFTAIGQLVPSYQVPGVIDQYGPEGKCDCLYRQARQTYNDICIRMNVPGSKEGEYPEDSDLEKLFCLMDEICQEVAYEMFRCGAYFQRQHTGQP